MHRIFAALALIAAACSGPPPAPPYAASEKTAGGVAFVVLSDQEAGVEASIAPEKGGELSGLRVRVGEEWVETLWLAEDYSPREGFGGKAPFLWPATGRSLPISEQNPDERGQGGSAPGGWMLGETRYPMTGHGFARDHPWELVSQEADASGARAVLRFSDLLETREMYPFGFELTATYQVSDGALSIRYDIRAATDNDGPMAFSIGNHITFKTPLLAGSSVEETTFVTPSQTRLLKNEFGFPNGEAEPRSHADGVSLAEWEPRVPISLTGYQGEPWVEIRDPQGLTMRMSHRASKTPQMPYIQFNVWGDPNDGYFSPEPWMGMQNSLNSKQGLIELGPGERFDWTITVQAEVSE